MPQGRKGKHLAKHTVLDLLENAENYLSGEEMSRLLGVSRTAVWKGISVLRKQGYEIEAKTNAGYRLVKAPDTPTQKAVYEQVRVKDFCPEILFLQEVDSTNTYLKNMAAKGLSHGTVCIADRQTSGRGRRGRSFDSQEGKGLFFSILLKPTGDKVAENLTSITAFAALAVCDAILQVANVHGKIKWVNDIMVGGKKLAGILSEMSICGESGQIEYIIVGVGINVHYQADDFLPDVKDIATSLDMLTNSYVNRAKLAAALIDNFANMYTAQERDKLALTKRYQELSDTIGQEIYVIAGDTKRPALAVGIDENCALQVLYEDGTKDSLHYGEISIRKKIGK